MMTKLALALLAGAAAWGQSASSGWQEFAIGPPTRNASGWPPNGIRAEGVPLKRALARAFGVQENRVLGPEWLADTRYAITGIAANPRDFQPLFQAELTRQFHLLSHREARVIPVYVLKPLNTPSKLQPPVTAGAPSTISGGDGNNSIRLLRSTIASFAEMLGNVVNRPVIDESGLDGPFEINLRWKAGNSTDLQTAVQDQLGIQLADERRSVDVLVIDHIEKLQFK
jgi:uncharacterized protein (TIGR03435 family)